MTNSDFLCYTSMLISHNYELYFAILSLSHKSIFCYCHRTTNIYFCIDDSEFISHGSDVSSWNYEFISLNSEKSELWDITGIQKNLIKVTIVHSLADMGFQTLLTLIELTKKTFF